MKTGLRKKLYEIIFEADTKAGKLFDIILLIVIIISVAFVMLESIPVINNDYGNILKNAEWTITILFTLEYILRIIIVKNSFAYIKSFYGIIDLMAILPTYLGIFIIGTQGLIVIRALRLFRVFRIFKLTRYTAAGKTIMTALKNSGAKIGVFLFGILMVIIILGTIMYLVEGEENGFTSIPKSVYWAIVTITTVGYGDISPQTPIGQVLAGIAMILGYAIIAVPTGIIIAEFTIEKLRKQNTEVCPYCLKEGHDNDAKCCNNCGKQLN
ncbi:ion transporter [Bacteroidota bacterium]